MSRIEDICSLEFVQSVLHDGVPIDGMIETLVLKADEEARNVGSLEELEGESIPDGDLRILKTCPMVPVINAVKKHNLAETGEDALPAYYREIVERCIEQYPGEAAILHPLCIVHQAMRDVISSGKGTLTRQIACRSGATGEVVFANKGLSAANLTEEQARGKIDGYACMYMTRAL